MSYLSEVESVLYSALQDGSVAAAVGRMVEPDMSSAIILALTDLCVAKDRYSYTGTLVKTGHIHLHALACSMHVHACTNLMP